MTVYPYPSGATYPGPLFFPGVPPAPPAVKVSLGRSLPAVRRRRKTLP